MRGAHYRFTLKCLHGEAEYKLRACIMHIGDDTSGHFVVVLRRYGTWYFVDDTDVHKLTELTQLSNFDGAGLVARVQNALPDRALQSLCPRAAFYERTSNDLGTTTARGNEGHQ